MKVPPRTKLVLAAAVVVVAAFSVHGRGWISSYREIPVDAAELAVARAAIASWNDLTPVRRGKLKAGQAIKERLADGSFYRSLDADEFASELLDACAGNPKLTEAAVDFLRKSRSSGNAASLLRPEDGLLVVSEQALEAFSESEMGFRQAFDAAFPLSHGLGTLSRVGLSADGTVAVMVHGCNYGPLMAFKKMAIFEFEGGTWCASARVLPFRIVS